MKKLKFLFFAMLLCGKVGAQEQVFSCAEKLNVSQQVTSIHYKRYNENQLVKKYDSFSQVTNATEEELMRSVLSASDLDWYNFNREEKVEKTSQDFNAIKSARPDAYYFTLVGKVNFTANGTEYAVVKFHLYDKGKIYGFAEAMKKINDRWVTTSDYQITDLLFFMGMVDEKYIDIIMNSRQTDHPELSSILGANTQNSRMDLNAVISSLQDELSKSKKLTSILDANRIFK